MILKSARIGIGLWMLVGGFSLALSAPSAAQSLFLPASTTEASSKATRHVKRERLVRIDPDVLANHVAGAGVRTDDREQRTGDLGKTVRLNLFADVAPLFTRTDSRATRDGDYVWEGDVPGRSVHEALLVVRNNEVSGRVQLDQRVFSITPIGGGKHRISELDMASFPPGAPPRVPPHVRNEPRTTMPTEGAEAAEATVIVRILVAYTTNAMNEAGGRDAIVGEIRRAIQLANQAYNRGGVGMTLELAGMMRVNYNESSDMGVDLERLTSATSLQSVRTRRADLKADLASLFRRRHSNFCGIAWFPDAGVMPDPSEDTVESGYSIVSHDCVENLSFHHELGHNMGLQHDRFVVSGNPSTNFYNFGYVNKPKRQRTIMAYNDACAPSFCTPINWFSSPSIRATGDVVIGKRAGTEGAADNTRRLKQIRGPISRYYPAP